MTTLRQIKKLIAPLLERHDDLALIGPDLFVKPVHHVASAIVINRSSSADVFDPRTASADIVGKLDHLGLGTGFKFRGRTGFLWRWSEPGMSDEFLRIAETEALPRMRSMRGLQAYYAYSEEVHGIHFPFYWGWRATIEVALGQLDGARDILNDARWADRSGVLFNREVDGLGDRLKALGADIAQEDKQALVDILHRWEAYSVEKLKLTAIWERTPFPLEEQL